jgi:PIN domain
MKTNYLLIDYENVQPKNLAALNGHAFKVIVFVGARQTKVPVEFARALQALGGNAEYVQISGSGSNALDLHIAFTIGELSKAEPDAYFHIISKDSDYDPLIKHLRSKRILATRSKSFADVPLIKVTNARSAEERVDAVVKNLISKRACRPRKVKKLANTIDALFLKTLKQEELSTLTQALMKQGYISVDGENVTYHLPEAL